MRLSLAKSADVTAQGEQIQHPCEYSPLIGRYLEKLVKEQPEIFNNYLSFLNIRIGQSKEAGMYILFCGKKTLFDLILKIVN